MGEASVVSNFSIDYSLAEMFCVLTLALLLAADRRIGTESETGMWFRRAMKMTILYFCLDALWSVAYGSRSGFRQSGTAILDYILCLALSAVGFSLFMFVATYEKYGFIRTRRNHILCALPAVICDLAMTVCFITRSGHITEEDGSLTPAAGLIFLLAPAFYCLFSAYLSFRGEVRQLTDEHRSFYRTLGIYPILMIIAGIIETLFVSSPLFAYTMTAGMVYIYVSFTADRILTDQLTGLKYRASMDHFIRNHAREGNLHEYTLFMIDMNGLKSLNDVYGHAAGDESLKTVSEGIMEILAEHSFDGYACRYGGDEFLLVLHVTGEEKASSVEKDLREMIRSISHGKGLDLTPQIAAGHEFLGPDAEAFDEALKSADERMYIDKRKMEEGNRRIDLFRDKVTGLPNVNYFHNTADRSLSSFRQSGRVPAVVYFDMTSMHAYNDRYGYSEGNRLLETVGSIIADLFPGDLLARYTDDRFVLITGDRETEEKCRMADRRVQDRFEGRNIALCAGIRFIDDDLENAVSAVDKARQARNYLGRSHESRVRVYDSEVRNYYDRRDYVLNHFDEAIEMGWIQPYYQPQVRTLTGRICGSEALARWVDPERGVLSPAVFIPVLEETHRIVKLDLLIVRRVCEIAKRFSDEGVDVQPVSFNLSQVDFQLCDMFEAVDRIRREFGVDPSLLKVEITESALTGSKELMQGAIRKFQEHGYQVWMDDFGSDYSSLRTLSAYSFDLMKIDMGFLREFEQNPHVKIVISSIVRMAKRLGIHTLCEGVETEDQYRFLRDIGCERVQGFLISKPVPLEEMIRIVTTADSYGYESQKQNAYYDAAGLAEVTGDPTLEENEENTGLPVSVIERIRVGSTGSDGAEGESRYRIRRLFVNEACRSLMQSLGRTGDQMETYVTEGEDARQYGFFLRNMARCGKAGETVSDVAQIEGSLFNVRMRMVTAERDRAMFACVLLPVES